MNVQEAREELGSEAKCSFPGPEMVVCHCSQITSRQRNINYIHALQVCTWHLATLKRGLSLLERQLRAGCCAELLALPCMSWPRQGRAVVLQGLHPNRTMHRSNAELLCQLRARETNQEEQKEWEMRERLHRNPMGQHQAQLEQ